MMRMMRTRTNLITIGRRMRRIRMMKIMKTMRMMRIVNMMDRRKLPRTTKRRRCV